MVKDAWTGKEITVSIGSFPVAAKGLCPLSGQPVTGEAFDSPLGRFSDCPECKSVVGVRINGTFRKHTVKMFSEPQDIVVVRSGSQQVLEIAASDIPLFIEQLRDAITSETRR